MKFLWEKKENFNLGVYGISHPICLKSDFWTFKIHTVLGKLMLPISTALELTDCIYLYLNSSAFWNFFYIYISSHSTSYNQNQPRQNCVDQGLPVYNFLQILTILFLWFIQSPLHLVPGALYTGINLPGHEADHSLCSPICLHGTTSIYQTKYSIRVTSNYKSL